MPSHALISGVDVALFGAKQRRMARKTPLLRIVLPGREWIDMRGARVHRSIGIDGTTDRAVLFSWSADSAALKRNVVRVDAHGNVVWRAELPDKARHDCFVDLKRDKDKLLARTFSGWVVSLDLNGTTLDVAREAAAA